MPNPTIIHPQSIKTKHFLAIADLYIELKQPKIYEVEPEINADYRPDAYAILGDNPVIIELQRTRISTNKMQNKVNLFWQSFLKKEHDSHTLWIVADQHYDITVPQGASIVQKKLEAAI